MTIRVNTGGNYCGHDPSQPRFKLVDLDQFKLLPIVRAAIENVRNYYSKPSMLQALSKIKTFGKPRQKYRGGTIRGPRSESRDIDINVMQSLLMRLNLFRLQIGVVPYDNPKGLIQAPTAADIAQEIGASVVRVHRSLAHWKHAGYISITPRKRKNAQGQWESIAPIICIQKHFFSLIGISEKWLETVRQYAYKKYKQEREKRFKKAIEKQSEKRRAQTMGSYGFVKGQLSKATKQSTRSKAPGQTGTGPPGADPPKREKREAPQTGQEIINNLKAMLETPENPIKRR